MHEGNNERGRLERREYLQLAGTSSIAAMAGLSGDVHNNYVATASTLESDVNDYWNSFARGYETAAKAWGLESSI